MEDNRLYTRAEARAFLNVTESTLKRLCNKYSNELRKMGYYPKTKLIRSKCVLFLKENYRSENPLCKISDKLTKNKIAESLGYSSSFLTKLLNTGCLYEKLKEKNYNKYQKILTIEQYEIANAELLIDY
jgi:hypothetical protein